MFDIGSADLYEFIEIGFKYVMKDIGSNAFSPSAGLILSKIEWKNLKTMNLCKRYFIKLIITYRPRACNTLSNHHGWSTLKN